MSTIIGNILDSGFILDETGLTPQVSEFLEANFPFEVENPNLAYSGSGITSNVPISVEFQSIEGNILETFGDLFFNRIHVVPVKIDVGNLANKQTREIEIFNAWILESADLDAVTPNGVLSGVDFDITPPISFPPLTGFSFELTINTSGTPAFNGFYQFDFGSKSAPDLTVLGRRIILFPFRHNWSQLPKEVLEYLTTIHEGTSDMEQGVKLRPFPRRRITYFHSPIEDGDLANIADNRSELEALLYSWINRIFALPIWEDVSVLQNDLASGSLNIPLSTVGLDYDEGSYVILWKDSKTFELIEIETVNSGSLGLARATDLEWSQGALILPARLSRLNSEVELSGDTEEHLQFETEWILESNQKSTNRIGTYTALSYRGFPVFMETNQLDDKIKIQLSEKNTQIDYGLSTRTVIRKGYNPRSRFSIFHLNSNRSEISSWYGFLENRSGKLNPCWYPTWARDFELLNVVASGATSMVVRGNRFSNIYGKDYDNFGLNRRDILIRWKDKTNFFVRILSASPVDENSETLLLNGSFPKELQVAQVDRISFIRFARFESDNVEVTKENNNVSRSTINLRELVASE